MRTGAPQAKKSGFHQFQYRNPFKRVHDYVASLSKYLKSEKVPKSSFGPKYLRNPPKTPKYLSSEGDPPPPGGVRHGITKSHLF